jgi:hypothetical protein
MEYTVKCGVLLNSLVWMCCICARVWTSQSHTASRTLMYLFILLLWRCDSYRRRHVNEAEVDLVGHFNPALFCKDKSNFHTLRRIHLGEWTQVCVFTVSLCRLASVCTFLKRTFVIIVCLTEAQSYPLLPTSVDQVGQVTWNSPTFQTEFFLPITQTNSVTLKMEAVRCSEISKYVTAARCGSPTRRTII